MSTYMLRGMIFFYKSEFTISKTCLPNLITIGGGREHFDRFFNFASKNVLELRLWLCFKKSNTMLHKGSIAMVRGLIELHLVKKMSLLPYLFINYIL